MDLKAIPAGEEIVITGFSGKFPKANNVAELNDNLYNHVDMISVRKYITHPELPKRLGQLPNPDKFDAAFFNITDEEANFIDPGGRMLLENTYEALLDAGMNPAELYGTDTRVYLGVTYSETDRTWFHNGDGDNGIGIIGSSRAVMASRISRWLNLRGPSVDVDTACSSGLYALELAYRDLRLGHCDYAIVTASNLCLTDATTMQFYKLGLLSQDGKCKTFDERANGYVRSEAVTVMILTRSKFARRTYAEIIHVKTNCDGYKPQGITYPSGEKQKLLLTEFYQEVNIDPTSIPYIEAHGTGTKVGDYEESGALCEIFCKNRGHSLPVGSIKTNLGHSEASSGLCSIFKIILCFENGEIPANLHYKTARKEIPGLQTGLFHVVTENTPFDEDYAALSGFGFGGANCHVLLKRNGKLKVDGGRPKDDLPRIVALSARNVETIRGIIDDLVSRPLDAEYIALYHNIFAKDIPNHPYRSYVILQKTEPYILDSKIYQFERMKPRKVWLVVNNTLEISTAMVRTLMEIPSFKTIISMYNQYLKPFQLDIFKLLVEDSHSILGSIVLQMGVVDLLKRMGVDVDHAVGGEVVAAYAKGDLTDHEAILTAYFLNYNEHVVTRRKNGHFIITDANANECTKMYSVTNRPTHDAPKIFQAYKKINENVFRELDSNAIIITLAPMKRIKEFLNGYMSNTLGFVTFSHDHIEHLLSAFGQLFLMGLNLNLAELYPPVQYPVSRNTPMISSLLKWNHLKSYVVQTDQVMNMRQSSEQSMMINVHNSSFESIAGHVIDGRNLYPATGYLMLVWDVFSQMESLLSGTLPVIFEDVKFLRATNVPANGTITFDISISRGTGRFEILEDDSLVVVGRIQKLTHSLMDIAPPTDTLTITAKDVYKDLRLRGYNYQGKFQSILAVNTTSTVGEIVWDESSDWTAFMDNMLQLAILKEDARFLIVPTGIKRLLIDPTKHRDFIHPYADETVHSITVAHHKDIDLLKGGGVEISGLQATAINRRKTTSEPVLERQEFIPFINETTSRLETLRILLQLALQENPSILIKIIEIPDGIDTTKPKLEKYHMFDILKILNDLPLIQSEMVVLTKEPLEDLPKQVMCVDQPITKESDAYIIIGHRLLSANDERQFDTITKSLKNESSFIITIEQGFVEPYGGYDILADMVSDGDHYIMLRKVNEKEINDVIHITDDVDFLWLKTVQTTLAANRSVILYAQNEPCNGLIGLVNCLQKESNGGNVQGVFIDDPEAPPFNPTHSFYANQLKKQLKVNVYRNGRWGNFKHLKIEGRTIESECTCVAMRTRGDLSSFRWIERPLQTTDGVDYAIVDVYYASLNFRDVMLATGRLMQTEILKDQTLLPTNVAEGFEFAGRNVVTGKRCIGISSRGSIANRVAVNVVWDIPDSWTLEDAATVPVVYSTVYYGLVSNGLTAGNSVLIHAGTGGIGLSAINLCLQYGCEVFTTVGTPEKRDFIKKTFPQIDDQHIGNSRDTSFEYMIMEMTEGRGVDFVLNSLAEEKLLASARCLAEHGKFIEIGKYDLANDNQLGMELFLRGASFHGVMLDTAIKRNDHVINSVRVSVMEGINNGTVKPIHRHVFHRDEIEQAFRFMAAGKHLGKVLLKIRDEESELVTPASKLLIPAATRLYCDIKNTTVIVGGLGGFGLELCSWLIERGCRNLVLSSRNGVKTGYQRMKIRKWQDKGVDVVISTADVSTKEGCMALLKSARQPIEAIYNLAAVLNDATIENQTVETFQKSFQGKALATRYLDEVSRTLCPALKYFVVFSSVVCGRGNAGQTNYGMANAVMERICEKRHREGLPAIAIQWGAIGEVGLVADMQKDDKLLEIGGTLQQSLKSCFETLDALLKQPYPVVGSMIVAEKKRYGFGAGGNLAEAIFNILGVRDINTVSPQSTLAELGMDSMMAVEIKQTLEREYDLFFTATDIRNLTFAKLLEIQNRTSAEGTEKKTIFDESLYQRLVTGYQMENSWDTGSDNLIVKMASLGSDTSITAPPLIIIPGIDGQIDLFKPIAAELKQQVYIVKLGFRNFQSIQEMVDIILNEIQPLLVETKQFAILAYSFGCIPATELAWRLQSEGFTGRCSFIDGAPLACKQLVFASLKLKVNDEISKIESTILNEITSIFTNGDTQSSIENLTSLPDLEARLKVCESILPTIISPKHFRMTLTAILGRCQSILNYEIPAEKIFSSPVLLILPDKLIVSDISDDYYLSQICTNPDYVTTQILSGNHYTILNNTELSNIINKFFLE